jgi:putative oxidoreductase
LIRRRFKYLEELLMTVDFGKLLARATVGLAFASHGAQKAFGAFGGPGLQGAAGFFETLGFKPGSKYATLASYTELISGLLIALGLGGPLGPAGLLGVMTVAMSTVHVKNGFYAQKNGIEVPLLYSAAAVAIAMGGYGRLSLDAVLGLDKAFANERLTWAALAAGPLGGMLALSQREKPPVTSF